MEKRQFDWLNTLLDRDLGPSCLIVDTRLKIEVADCGQPIAWRSYDFFSQ